MKKIAITLTTNPYDIYLKEGLLDTFSTYLPSKDNVVIITDTLIPKPYIATVKSQLNHPLVITIPSGETSKSFHYYQQIIEEMLRENIPKSGTLIALGGGVVGDLAGFVASTYMRGINFVQIPTTLLSQIDSSVGGKVAINSKDVKNSVGTFYQPKAVFIDPSVLTTLDQKQLSSGLAEMIKYGVISDPSILSYLEEEPLFSVLPSLIEQCIAIKKQLVLEDEFDQHKRHILNFGHTFGHAIEQHSKYQYTHGEAVAIGMSIMTGNTSFHKRLISLLKKFSLPYRSPYTFEELAPYILHDKKRQDQTLNLVVVQTLGEAQIIPVHIKEVKHYWEEK